MFLIRNRPKFVKKCQSWIMICQMTKNIFFVDKSTYHKWGDNVLKVCPSIKWSLNSLSLSHCSIHSLTLCLTFFGSLSSLRQILSYFLSRERKLYFSLSRKKFQNLALSSFHSLAASTPRPHFILVLSPETFKRPPSWNKSFSNRLCGIIDSFSV